MKSVKGFTLIELMVTIAVAAILVSIAVPSFRNLIVSNRLNALSTEMVDAISYARSESIKRNSPIVFCRAATSAAITCASGATWSHWVILSGSDVIRRGEINSYNATIRVASDLTSDRVVFGGDGLARTGGNIITESEISLCSTSGPNESIRQVTFGAASRVSTNKVAGTCS